MSLLLLRSYSVSIVMLKPVQSDAVLLVCLFTVTLHVGLESTGVLLGLIKLFLSNLEQK